MTRTRGIAGLFAVVGAIGCGSTVTGDDDTPGADARQSDPIGCTVFPGDNPWNTDVSGFAVHANSTAYVDTMGRSDTMHPDFGTEFDGAPNGIPFVAVDANTARVPVSFDFDDESDPGPYPIPPDAPVEGGPSSDGDRHVIAIDTDACVLYELYYAFPVDSGARWTAGSGAIFELDSNALRPDGFTSADAAGLPIFPGLVRYEEVVERGVIPHALRITARATQNAFIHPATHGASNSTDASRPPMGLRMRMKADYDCSSYSNEVQIICTAFKTYGVFIADNGSDWFLSGAPDPRWSDSNLRDLGDIPGDAFEAVETGPIIPQP